MADEEEVVKVVPIEDKDGMAVSRPTKGRICCYALVGLILGLLLMVIGGVISYFLIRPESVYIQYYTEQAGMLDY